MTANPLSEQSPQERAQSAALPSDGFFSPQGFVSTFVTATLRYPSLYPALRDHLADLSREGESKIRAALLGPGGLNGYSPQTLEVAALLRSECRSSSLLLVERDPEILASALSCYRYRGLSPETSQACPQVVRDLMLPVLRDVLVGDVPEEVFFPPMTDTATEVLSLEVDSSKLRERVNIGGVCCDFRRTDFENAFGAKFHTIIATYTLNYAFNFADPEGNWRLLENIVRGLQPGGRGKFFVQELDLIGVAHTPHEFENGMRQRGLETRCVPIRVPATPDLLMISRA